jgi:hypothetical protein
VAPQEGLSECDVNTSVGPDQDPAWLTLLAAILLAFFLLLLIFYVLSPLWR